jgi:hypothetical protein
MTGGQVIEVANFTVFTVALFCDKGPICGISGSHGGQYEDDKFSGI